jgi:hypothetical protein
MNRCCGLFLALAVLAACLPGAGGQDKEDVIHLFNGQDLTNFYTWLGAPEAGKEPYGKNNDPDKVFSVKNGHLHVSGKVFGGLITEKEYENYHLIVEFKWGEKTWGKREKAARDSGILLHCVGKEGAAGGVWMESIECQMIEGGTGDFILVGGKETPRLTVEAEDRPTGAGEKKHLEPYYKKGAPEREFKGRRINWYGRDPAWQDVKGFRGGQDVERPVGEWNRLEVICDGDRIINILNDKKVNEGRKASHTRGKILVQSEGAEVIFRRIDLRPLKK